jgi:hypothetical protein
MTVVRDLARIAAEKALATEHRLNAGLGVLAAIAAWARFGPAQPLEGPRSVGYFFFASAG